MGVIDVEQRSVVPFSHGYERVDAVVRLAVDPAHPRNLGIVDLDLAPRHHDGLVHFEADLIVLRPTGSADGPEPNGVLLGWVTNRGRIAALPYSVPPPGFVPTITPEIEVGNAYLLRRGWTIALLGWQWDVERQPGMVGLDAPLAAGVTAEVTVQFQPSTARHIERLAHWPWHPDPATADGAHRVHPVADLAEPDATLTVAESLDGPSELVARDRWHFPDEAHIELADGFEPGRVYRVTYHSALAPVAGCGLLAVRDVMAHLRRTEAGIDHVIGAGVSQTGRFLREFLHGGFNVDEHGNAVFDGLQIQIAGARRGDFNRRGAQPSSQYLPGTATAEPPYDYEALLGAQRALGGVPRIMHIDSSSEYWRSDAYLVHGEDGPPPEVRCYLMAGSQHFPGLAGLSHRPATQPEVSGANLINTLNHAPLFRANLEQLVRWVADGVEPPPSNVPRLADAGAADRLDVLEQFAGSGLDVEVVDPDLLVGTCRYVPAVGADGNELAGIRLPAVSVPLAAHTGWNVRGAADGGAGQPMDMAGSLIPFAEVPELGGYLDRVAAAADELVATGWLLEEDVPGVVSAAERLHGKLSARLAPADQR